MTLASIGQIKSLIDHKSPLVITPWREGSAARYLEHAQSLALLNPFDPVLSISWHVPRDFVLAFFEIVRERQAVDIRFEIHDQTLAMGYCLSHFAEDMHSGLGWQSRMTFSARTHLRRLSESLLTPPSAHELIDFHRRFSRPRGVRDLDIPVLNTKDP